jgi:hypothetical protein
MKKLLFISFSLLQFFMGRAQTGVYKTYEDFVSGHIMPMKKVDHIKTPRAAKTMITFVDSADHKITFRGDQVWGCIIKGQLFRGELKAFIVVLDTGKICFYENGISDLRRLTGDKRGETMYDLGFYSISTGLNGKLYDSFEKFFKAYPEYRTLTDCRKKDVVKPRYVTTIRSPRNTGTILDRGDDIFDYSETTNAWRKCIAEFNANH